jgi:hypothetical protein
MRPFKHTYIGDEVTPELDVHVKISQVEVHIAKQQEELEPGAVGAGRRGERGEHGMHRQAPRC